MFFEFVFVICVFYLIVEMASKILRELSDYLSHSDFSSKFGIPPLNYPKSVMYRKREEKTGMNPSLACGLSFA